MNKNRNNRSVVLIAAFCGGGLIVLPVSAHHSTAEYNANEYVEARGEVVSVLWRNPHVRFQISTKAIDGNDQLWELESTELTRLDRAGVPRDILKVGDVVTFAGNPSIRTVRRMYVTNLLVTDGHEYMFRNNVKPRWAPDRALNTDSRPLPKVAGAPSSNRDFLGKVFIATRGTNAPAWVGNLPLTEAARKAKEAYDETLDDPTLGCLAPGMPRVMLRAGPYAFRFVERGSDLVLELEFFGLSRVIHMDGKEPSPQEAFTPLGYSAGRWEGASLAVTTTHIAWPYFESYAFMGIPQSRAMQFVERFTPTDGGTAIKYDFAATDPTTFKETVAWENYATLQSVPRLEFLPYDCIEEERKPRSAR